MTFKKTIFVGVSKDGGLVTVDRIDGQLYHRSVMVSEVQMPYPGNTKSGHTIRGGMKVAGVLSNIFPPRIIYPKPA